MRQKAASKRREGFTLIELVVVIVILGILAAIAVPKFVALDTQAKTSVLAAGAASLQSASLLQYANNAAGGSANPNPSFNAITSNTSLDTNIFISSPTCTGAVLHYGTSGGTPTFAVGTIQFCS